MTIDVEIRLVAMPALTNRVGHPSHGKNIAGTVQGQSIGRVKPLARKHFLVNGREPRIVSLEGVGLKGVLGNHPFDDIAGMSGSAITNHGSWFFSLSRAIRTFQRGRTVSINEHSITEANAINDLLKRRAAQTSGGVLVHRLFAVSCSVIALLPACLFDLPYRCSIDS
jgi:hypothetical protein